MGTLILAEEHRNQYYYEKKPLGLGHDGFRPSPSKTFRQINCRTFHSGVGLLRNPPKRTHSPPSPKSVLPSSLDCVRTKPIPIGERRSLSYYSELWAGPTYSNSPPPTSVPIPKFSLRQKRTVSLTFPAPDLDVDLPEVAKSAPVSPTSSGGNPFHCTVSATMTLRRILNIETADE
ncbi:unnamed protein product [Eruca vesicaria subsp. sativa]|uniref:Uncharacterized protein n=1 Tax=Eruca vesicaria subsp. sativa TaxID=29727 RepID=A0ABC8K2Y1_ERUVS|nr:unnamed protein product [Eruca vesicaria subsp. sativa]